MDNKFWFGFKLKKGMAIAQGPYSREQVNIERARAKAPDADVSQWFIADNQDEAQKKAEFFLPRD